MAVARTWQELVADNCHGQANGLTAIKASSNARISALPSRRIIREEIDSHRERNLLHAEPSAMACWRVSQLLKISVRTSAGRLVGNVIVDYNLGEKRIVGARRPVAVSELRVRTPLTGT